MYFETQKCRVQKTRCAKHRRNTKYTHFIIKKHTLQKYSNDEFQIFLPYIFAKYVGIKGIKGKNIGPKNKLE